MNEDGEETWALDDPRVPNRVREHARQFKKQVTTVVALGDDEYLLLADDGELVDGVILQSDEVLVRTTVRNELLPASITWGVLGVLLVILIIWAVA